jgi:hypothetical protein
MKNDELKKIRYLLYILEEFAKLNEVINSFFMERDIRIDLILVDSTSKSKQILDAKITEIEGLIESIKLLDIDTNLAESIAIKVDDLINITYDELKIKV